MRRTPTGQLIVRRPSWGSETIHVDLASMLDVWMAADARYAGVIPPDRQDCIETLEEGSTLELSGSNGSVSYFLRRVEV